MGTSYSAMKLDSSLLLFAVCSLSDGLSIQPGILNFFQEDGLAKLAPFWRSECRKWKKEEIYLEGDKVDFNGEIFQAKWWTSGAAPQQNDQDWGDWEYLGTTCSDQGTDNNEVDEEEEEEEEVIVDEDEDTDDNNGTDEEDQDEENEIGDKPKRGEVPTKKQAEEREAELTDTDLFRMVKKSISTLQTPKVEQIKPGRAANPANVKRLERILSAKDWEYLFPDRHPDYSYRRFLQAIGKFPAVCGDYKDGRNADLICKKTLATMFAHFTQETGGHDPNSETEQWRQGLVYLREAGCSEDGPGCEYDTACDPSTWQGKTWPCGKKGGKYMKYYGRGAKQLSYNFNYGPFSDAMFGTVTKLLENPDMVASTWLNLASAAWFYAYPQPPKPSMLHVIDGTWQPNKEDKKNKLEPGFGATIMIINGGIECGHGYEKPQALNRQKYYRNFAKYFKLDITGEQLSCAHMDKFSKGGAGALLIYWDREWVKEYECQLVKYQTPYNALKPGDYVKCVEEQFHVILK